ncbi:DUF4326 domain-containing protein [Methylorubrum suomiense]|uniref:DUF4326 domain-containing protein n=1 Tax=Methylorubrum suomiense TaxID=144191 RepID=UPI001EE32C5B|nr:DUF4326 domain-containing protein [Methylorubrum suomiense]
MRLQLSRKKGFDLQAHSRAVNGLPAVNVARPSKWGNPFPVINTGFVEEHQSAVDRFKRLFKQPPSRRRHAVLTILVGNNGRGEAAVARMLADLPSLRGKNLGCWCALCPDHAAGKPFGIHCCECSPCHADALLELSNSLVCEAVDAKQN